MNRIAQALLLVATLSMGLLVAGPLRAQGEFRGFSVAELDQMLAPVALYPDTVLSHVLIAATYPIEVVQAARWTRQNPDLRGEQAVNAVIGQDWDPSVMALVAFPEVLARMDADLDWTQKLGDAFLVQEADVLDSIQRLRAQAYDAGHLRSSEQVQVIREREVIYIEPPRRQVVFVPVYDTRVVFGSWAWAHHPPVFWHAPPRPRSSVVVYWGPAFHVPSAFFFSSFHWSRREVVVVHHHHHYFRPHHPRPRSIVHHHHHHYLGRDLARHDAAQRWQHDPGHRRGVAYHPAVDERHRQLERRSAASSAPTSAASAPPLRVAETRGDQRAWAESRRAEPMLQASGNATARTARAVTETARAASDRSATAARSAAQTRPTTPNAAAPRNVERSSARASAQAAPASPTAGSIEAQLQQRPAAQRQSARPLSSATNAGNAPRSAAMAPGSVQNPRAAARPERQPQSQAQRPAERQAQRPVDRQVQRQVERPASAAASARAPAPVSRNAMPQTSSRSVESRSSVSAPAPARAPAAAASMPRSAPQRQSSAPSPRMPEARAPQSQRPLSQGATAPRQAAATPRADTRAPAADRRAARQLD